MENNIFAQLFPTFPHFSPFFHVFKLFHQKVWFKYQLLGVLRTKLQLVKNLITDIRTNFKDFQITFPPILSYFSPLIIFFLFSGFMNSVFIENSKIFWTQTGFPNVFKLVKLNLPFRLQSWILSSYKHETQPLCNV